MALWKEILNLKSEDLNIVSSFYNDQCPIEVRGYCARWIEDEINKGTDPQTFFNGLIYHLQARAASLLNSDQFWVKLKLLNIVEHFQKTYSNNPAALLHILKQAIQKEYELVQNSEQRGNNVVSNASIQYQDISLIIKHNGPSGISDSIQVTKKMSSDAGAALKKIEDELQALNLNYKELQRCNAKMQQQRQMNLADNGMELAMEVRALHSAKNENVTIINSLKIYVEETVSNLVMYLSKIVSEVIDNELQRWLNGRHLYGNDESFTDIDLIQRWCEETVELIWTTREHLRNAAQLRFPGLSHQNNGAQNNFTAPFNTCTHLLSKLLQEAFIVHSIPSQILKTCTRFPPPHNVIIKFLIGGKLNVSTTQPQVQIEFLNEKSAKNLIVNGVVGKPNGVLMNNKGRLEYNRDTGDFSAVFKNLKTVSREKTCSTSAGANSDVVTREKFFLVATTNISVGDLNLKLWALSPPVVIISHGSQEAQGWATITWTNVFGSKGPSPQEVPDTVSWTQLAELLNRFAEKTLGRGLSTENLNFLARKTPIKDGFVKLIEFTKAQPGYAFSIWEWYFRAIKLIEKEKHLKELWAEGYILGFISKSHGETLLTGYTPGNFLIRISESVLGAITFSWIEKDGIVYSMEPFTSKCLGIQSLSDKVRDLENFEFIYPDIPKDIVFKKYYEVIASASVVKSCQYVKPFMSIILRGSQFQGSSTAGSLRSSVCGSSISGAESSPNTPQPQPALSTSAECGSNSSFPTMALPLHDPMEMDNSSPQYGDYDWLDENLEEILRSQSTLPVPNFLENAEHMFTMDSDDEDTPL